MGEAVKKFNLWWSRRDLMLKVIGHQKIVCASGRKKAWKKKKLDSHFIRRMDGKEEEFSAWACRQRQGSKREQEQGAEQV